jgi:hypothetical protein
MSNQPNSHGESRTPQLPRPVGSFQDYWERRQGQFPVFHRDHDEVNRHNLSELDLLSHALSTPLTVAAQCLPRRVDAYCHWCILDCSVRPNGDQTDLPFTPDPALLSVDYWREVLVMADLLEKERFQKSLGYPSGSMDPLQRTTIDFVGPNLDSFQNVVMEYNNVKLYLQWFGRGNREPDHVGWFGRSSRTATFDDWNHHEMIGRGSGYVNAAPYDAYILIHPTFASNTAADWYQAIAQRLLLGKRGRRDVTGEMLVVTAESMNQARDQATWLDNVVYSGGDSIHRHSLLSFYELNPFAGHAAVPPETSSPIPNGPRNVPNPVEDINRRSMDTLMPCLNQYVAVIG